MPTSPSTIGGGIDQCRRRLPTFTTSCHQLHLMPGGEFEADRLALADLLTLGDALHGVAGGLDAGLEMIEIVLVFNPECEAVEADAGVVANGQRSGDHAHPST